MNRAVTVIQRGLKCLLEEKRRQEASKSISEEQTPHSRGLDDQQEAESYYSEAPKEDT